MLHATNILSFVHFGSHLHHITNTEHRPAEAGLEEVEEPVALPSQMPGTKQLTKGSDRSAPNTVNATIARQRDEFFIPDSLL